MQFGDIMIIVLAVVVVVGGGLYFLNRWLAKKQVDQQSLIEKTKQAVSVYVIDKKRDKAENVTLPKVVMDGLPKLSRMMKLYFVKGKVGPQIVTMMCDKSVFEFVEPKKTYKAEIAGIYIVSVRGMKSAQEMKAMARERKVKEKQEQKDSKTAQKPAKDGAAK